VWIAISVHALVAIVEEELAIKRSLNEFFSKNNQMVLFDL